MPRTKRYDKSGVIYHVLNRANGRLKIFLTDEDYRSVIRSILDVKQKIPIEVLNFCIMPNHWHFIVKTKNDGDLGKFFGKLTQQITQRFHKKNQTLGTGHLYQGRFKSFPIQEGRDLLTLALYVESNPLRANLVENAVDWKWCSLWIRLNYPNFAETLLSDTNKYQPSNYIELVNREINQDSLSKIQKAIKTGAIGT